MPAYYLEIVVIALGLILLLLDAFVPGQDKRWIGKVGVLGLLVVFVMNLSATGANGSESVFWNFYTYEAGSFAGFYKGIAIFTTIMVLLMSLEYHPVLRSQLEPSHAGGEFYVLPLFTCAGLMWMASATDLISIFVSLELVTISFYVLVTFTRRKAGALEAGVKYLILGALSTGFMVYGIAWIFGVTGETNLEAIQQLLGDAHASADISRPALLLAFGLILVALAFKIGAVPFQIWQPDVYQGAPTPITAYLSIASKSAAFIILLRIVEPFLHSEAISGNVLWILSILAGATILFGSLIALTQDNIKRLLAYASMSHAGVLLMAIACSPAKDAATALGPDTAISFNLAAYMLSASLAFFVICIVRAQLEGEEVDTFRGLGRRSPFLAFSLTIAAAGLAGVPLTAGFVGKFLVFRTAVIAESWWLLGIAVLAAVSGFYYYLKVVRMMYFSGGKEDEEAEPLKVSTLSKIAMLALIGGILYYGVAFGQLLKTGQDSEQAAVEDVVHP
ncbi:MAG: NADH-quinone oxidoreductase subunit N [Verrucomicrobiales bacterium]|jgi:NADH-quinone oxidoreductase subunit N